MVTFTNARPKDTDSPCPCDTQDKMGFFRWIKAHHQYSYTKEGVMVDASSANIVVQVYDALNESNKKKYIGMPVEKMVKVAWSLAG